MTLKAYTDDKFTGVARGARNGRGRPPTGGEGTRYPLP